MFTSDRVRQELFQAKAECDSFRRNMSRTDPDDCRYLKELEARVARLSDELRWSMQTKVTSPRAAF